MNRADFLPALIEAGISSFKIEGRLKDISYVKNITAYYRQKLDAILSGKNGYQASSSGKCTYTFTPNPQKSFNRGFTDYFLTGKKTDITSFDTPKSTGEFVGIVESVHKNSFKLSGKTVLHNGDGLCFLNSSGEFSGFRINKVENNTIFVKETLSLPIGTRIYRNSDILFEKSLSSERKISLQIIFSENHFRFYTCCN